MFRTGSLAPARSKRWLFRLLAACVLVFQSSGVLHDLDIAAHSSEADCEICELCVPSNDDAEAALSAPSYPTAGDAAIVSARLPSATAANKNRQPGIRAPPQTG